MFGAKRQIIKIKTNLLGKIPKITLVKELIKRKAGHILTSNCTTIFKRTTKQTNM